MNSTETDLERRKQAAMQAMMNALGTEADEFGATLFVSHHLEEIAADYWNELLGTATPEAEQILQSLVLQPTREDDDDEENLDLDFTLPGDVTDYVLCISFDENGDVDGIVMES